MKAVRLFAHRVMRAVMSSAVGMRTGGVDEVQRIRQPLAPRGWHRTSDTVTGFLLALLFVTSTAHAATSDGYAGLTLSHEPVRTGEEVTISWNAIWSTSTSCTFYRVGDDGWTMTTIQDGLPNPGSIALTPTEPGWVKYGVGCGDQWSNGTILFLIEEGAGYEPPPAPAPAITSFEVAPGPSSAPFEVGRRYYLRADFPHNKQTCSISGDYTLAATTPTAYGSTFYIQVQPSSSTTWQEAREHSFTLTCSNDSGEPDAVRTITQNVAPKPPEPLIELGNARFTQWPDQYSELYAAASIRLTVDVTNPKSGVPCTATLERPDGSIVTLSATGSSSQTNYTVGSNMAGTYTATAISCTNLDGVQSNVIAGPITAQVKGAPKILSFGVDDGDIRTGESAILQWTTENAVSCDITDAESGATTAGLLPNGSFEFAARPRAGDYHYDLTCYSDVTYQGTALNTDAFDFVAGAIPQRLTVKVVAAPYQHGEVSGKWLGEYHFFMGMRTSDPSGVTFSMKGNMCTVGEDGNLCPTPEPWTPQYFSHRDEAKVIGRMASMLGKNIDPSYWLWDFDALQTKGHGEIWLGSSTLLAMDAVYVPFRLYDPSKMKDARQRVPEERPELWQMVGTFVPSNDPIDGPHVYHVRFNQQIFLSMANYPLAKLELRLGIANNGDGTLYIGTMKGHPADKDPLHYFTQHEVYNSTNGQRVSGAGYEYLLGAILPSYGEVAAPGTSIPAYNAFAPFRVSPLFGSTRMVKLDGERCDNGLPVEFYRQFLRVSGDKAAVCGAVPVVNGELDSDADGKSDIAEIAGANETDLDGVRNGGYVMPIKRDSQYDFVQPEAFWRKPWFAGLIPLGNGERAVLYSRHYDDEAEAPALGDYRRAVPGAVWEPVPKVFFGEADHLYLPTPAHARLPTLEVYNIGLTSCDILHRYELGSIRLPSVNTNAQREHRFYLYFNKGIPDGLELYELGEQTIWEILDQSTREPWWTAEKFKIQWERLPDTNDPGYATTVRFKIPVNTASGASSYMVSHIAIGHHNAGACFSGGNLTGPRTDVAFDASEPGYAALLEKAARWTSEQPATAQMGTHFYVNGRERREVTVVLGGKVTFSWQVNNTNQCRIAPADWSEADGAVSTPWVSAWDNYTIPVFDKVGEYRYQLVCDPDFAIGEEPEVVVVRVTEQADSSGNGNGSTPPPAGGAGTKPKSGGGSLGLDLLLPMMLLAYGVRRRRHSLSIR